MGQNIVDIINAVNCSHSRAKEIESHINDNWLINWPECELSELSKIALQVDKILTDKKRTK